MYISALMGMLSMLGGFIGFLGLLICVIRISHIRMYFLVLEMVIGISWFYTFTLIIGRIKFYLPINYQSITFFILGLSLLIIPLIPFTKLRVNKIIPKNPNLKIKRRENQKSD